ncbi:MAG: carboxynorspermidine decarboxylase, partial [Alloprevotella sp.]
MTATMQTPYYLLEEEKLRRNLALIRSIADRAGVEFILAFKAYALWKTFPIFREYISHTTASSPYEARLAFEEFGSKAHTYSPAYEVHTFGEIVRCSDYITFNSLRQFRQFSPQAIAAGVSCGLRINP